MTKESTRRNLYTREQWAKLQILKFGSIIPSNSEYEDSKFIPAYITTDGKNFHIYEDALDHQISLYPYIPRGNKRRKIYDFSNSK